MAYDFDLWLQQLLLVVVVVVVVAAAAAAAAADASGLDAAEHVAVGLAAAAAD